MNKAKTKAPLPLQQINVQTNNITVKEQSVKQIFVSCHLGVFMDPRKTVWSGV